MNLDAKLPDSMFVFTPPPGTKETDDWTLPGVSKPDVIGKAAPGGAGECGRQRQSGLLAYFATRRRARHAIAIVRRSRRSKKSDFPELVVIEPRGDFPEFGGHVGVSDSKW